MLEQMEKDLLAWNTANKLVPVQSARKDILFNMNDGCNNNRVSFASDEVGLKWPNQNQNLVGAAADQGGTLRGTTATSAQLLNNTSTAASDTEAARNLFQLKDSIYKKVSEIFKMLKKGEDEAQVEMLKWENFVIQQEKMQKLRQEIFVIASQSGVKLTTFQSKIGGLNDTIAYFSRTCELVSQAFPQINAATGAAVSGSTATLVQQQLKTPISPTSRGDGTTVATERDQETMEEQNLARSGNIIQSRRTLSITTSNSQLSIASDVHENIDLDETEQSLLEVQMLKKHISIFQNKIQKSCKVLDKRQDEHARSLK